MNSAAIKYSQYNFDLLKHILFWVCVFLYFMLSSNITNYEGGYTQLFHSTCKIIIPQIITAYTCLYVLVPKLFDQKKTIQFIFWSCILLVIMFVLYVSLHTYFYEPKYIQYYNDLEKKYAEDSFWERIGSFSVFLSKSILFLTPAVLLLMTRFYKNQQRLLKLNEQKKTAELTALKNQLNPHFLFNTLNNLYSLALKNAEQTPDVIEKLADILDYMLYRCNNTFVSLQKEIELIDNYLSLEKVRYGKRVQILCEKNIHQDVKIAPLLLLTFIENAFKHGVSQELKEAIIIIKINLENNQIIFHIKNSKPKASLETKEDNRIGLENVKKQLELLYPNNYTLDTENTKETYELTLKLLAK
ncbi:sensor histidine kinase [Roseivirga seohaensis]|uniref:sensor histidine kinase n=1 Tax=Roseivirga seohaensis TaxID=1914963 RepID=UPI003BAC166A